MYGQLLAKTPQPSAMVCVDLNDPSVLTALLEGQMAVQIEDQEGRILAVGETVSFAPVDSQAKKKIRHISESNMTKHVKELEEFEKETTQEVEQESLAEPIEISRVFKREVYVVVGRRNNEFKYVRYHESMPPRVRPTAILFTFSLLFRSLAPSLSSQHLKAASSFELSATTHRTCFREKVKLWISASRSKRKLKKQLNSKDVKIFCLPTDLIK